MFRMIAMLEGPPYFTGTWGLQLEVFAEMSMPEGAFPDSRLGGHRDLRTQKGSLPTRTRAHRFGGGRE